MAVSTEYSIFAALLELIERRSAARRTESIVFHDGAGNEIARFTIDGKCIRFGIELQGHICIDEIFVSDLPVHARLLQKSIDGILLSAQEAQLIDDILPQESYAFASLTARALWAIARYLKASGEEFKLGQSAPPRPRLTNLAFSMVDLALAAGRRDPIQYDDVAVKLYGTPPEHDEERWLLERRVDDAYSPWPILTTQHGERRVAHIATFASFAQLLDGFIRAEGSLGPPCAQILRFENSVCLIVCTARYVTLLVYHWAQMGRIVRALEQLIKDMPAVSPAPAQSPPAVQLAMARTIPPTTVESKSTQPWPGLAAASESSLYSDPEFAIPGPTTIDSQEPPQPTPHVAPLTPPEEYLTSPQYSTAEILELQRQALAFEQIIKTGITVDSDDFLLPSADAGAPSRPELVAATEEPSIAGAPEELLAAVAEPQETAFSDVDEYPTDTVVAAQQSDAQLDTPSVVPPAAAHDSPQDASPDVLPKASQDSAQPVPQPASQDVEQTPKAEHQQASAIGEEPTVEIGEPAALSEIAAAPPQALTEQDSQQSILEPAATVSTPAASDSEAVASPLAAENGGSSPSNTQSEQSETPIATSQPTFSDEPAVFPTFSDAVLVLKDFTAEVEDRTILKALTFSIGKRGFFTIMGPGGSGKSSLNGILSGRNRSATGWKMTGEILFGGLPLGTEERPAVVGQKIPRVSQPLRTYLLADLADGIAATYSAEQVCELLDRANLSHFANRISAVLDSAALKPTLSEWWRLAIARELTLEPRLLCVDEPTAAMSDEDAEPILKLLRAEATQRTVLMVTHNQQHARDYSDYVLLLAYGQVQEYGPVAEFFSQPHSRAAKDYIRTGSCYIAAPDAQLESLSEEYAATLVASQAAKVTTQKPALEHAQPQATVARPSPSAAPAPKEPAHAAAPITAAAHVAETSAAAGPVLWATHHSGTARALSLRDVALQVGTRKVLSGINLDIAAHGLYILVTPECAEKRLLVRALCGPRPSTMQLSGRALYQGRTLPEEDGPATPTSSAQLMMMNVGSYLTSNLPKRGNLSRTEQRSYAAQLVESMGFPELATRFDIPMTSIEVFERRPIEIIRAAAVEPGLLVLDEPLAGLSSTEVPALLRLLKQQATERAVLILARDFEPLSTLGAAVAWLADGGIKGQAPAPSSSEESAQPAVVAPTASSTKLAPEAAQPRVDDHAQRPVEVQQQPASKPRGNGPRGFHWLRADALAGMPAPGLTTDIGYDLDLIRSTGVTHLVTLTMEPLPKEPLLEHGLQSIFFPIEDMDAPTEEQAAKLCAQVQALLGQNQVIGFHCKAGLGRTGTMLASYLVWEGVAPEAALQQARTVEPNWVQSAKQENFLVRFAAWLRSRRAT